MKSDSGKSGNDDDDKGQSNTSESSNNSAAADSIVEEVTPKIPGPMDSTVNAAVQVQVTKKAVEVKEKAILGVMERRQADLKKEAAALDMIKHEMKQLAMLQQREITEVMNKLEETDKDLWYLERDFKAAEAEYLKTKGRFEKVKAAKGELVKQMTTLTLNAEKKKEEKLNGIMTKLRQDGVVFPVDALAGLT